MDVAADVWTLANILWMIDDTVGDTSSLRTDDRIRKPFVALLSAVEDVINEGCLEGDFTLSDARTIAFGDTD